MLNIIDNFKHVMGWNDNTIIQLMMEFIENNEQVSDFHEFISNKVKEQEVNRYGIRTVIFCPECGWESFDEDDYDHGCPNCGEILIGEKEEEYEI